MTIEKGIELHEAIDIVEGYLFQEFRHKSEIPVILREYTEEYDFGWVFYYDFARCIETDDDMNRMLGNSPLIVNRYTNEVVVTGTADATSFYVANYRETGDPHAVHPSRVIESISGVAEALKSPRGENRWSNHSGNKNIGLLVAVLDEFITYVRAAQEGKERHMALEEEDDERMLMLEWLIGTGEVDLDPTVLFATKGQGKLELWSMEHVEKAEAAIEDIKRAAHDMLRKGANIKGSSFD